MNKANARRALQIIAILAVIGCLFLLYRKMLGMSADTLFYINLVAQFMLILMGVAMALRDAWPRKHPWIVLAVFAVIGAVGMFASVKQAQQSEKENAEATRQIQESLDQTQQKVTALQGQVKEIQEQATRPGNPSEKLDNIAKILGTKTPPLPATTPTPVRGTAILSNGQVTVKSSAVTATSEIHPSSQDDGVSGTLRVINIKPGVSFDIVSTNLFDNGKVAWVMYP